MDPMYRKFLVRRIAEARQNSCYLEIFKLIFENNMYCIVTRSGVYVNLTPLSDEMARQMDDVLKRCEQRKKQVGSGVLPQ